MALLGQRRRYTDENLMPRILWTAIAEAASVVGLIASVVTGISVPITIVLFVACVIFGVMLTRFGLPAHNESQPEVAELPPDNVGAPPQIQPSPITVPTFVVPQQESDYYWFYFCDTKLSQSKASHYEQATQTLRQGDVFDDSQELQIAIGDAIHTWVADAFDAISAMYPGALRDDQQPLANARLYLAAWNAIRKGHVIQFDDESIQHACTTMADRIESVVRATRLSQSAV